MRLRAIALWLGLCASLSVTGRAAAEEAEPPAYRADVEQALSEYDAKNYEEASTLFARAHALYPNARTMRGLGMASFELRRYDESAAWLEQALASQVKPLDGELRAQTELLLTRARGFLAVVSVTLEPSTAQLLVDDRSVTAPGPLQLKLGEHVLEGRADGYRPARQTLRVHGGEVLQVELKLQRELLTAAPVERPEPLYKNPWLWGSVGAVVVAAVVVGAVLATRSDGNTHLIGTPDAHTPTGVSLSTLGVR